MIPARLGKYHVLGRLAQGGMAEIFKVKTVGLAGFEKIQVLKKILPAHAQNPRFIRSFIDEARIAVSLNHRNIVQVFEFGRVGGELFLAMELIEGVNLREVVLTARKKRRTLGVPLGCFVLAEVAAGLDYAHRKRDDDNRPLGIVHCDVSPQNVALSWEGYVKVLDFGVSRATFVAAEKGRLRGKPRYMAPEQTRGQIPSSGADVFALGVVGWELIVGAPLFDGPDVESILRAIQRLDVRDPRAVQPAVPDALAEAILVALSREPERRGTAADLLGVCTRTMRELDPQVGSRALARVLAELFPESPLNADEPVDEPSAPSTSPSRIVFGEGDSSLATPTAPEPAIALAENDLLAAEVEAPEPLDEKRRVVAVACRLSGGELRRLERAISDIAYKHGAIVHSRSSGEVILLFGLELQGEDDFAHALRFAAAAADVAREADTSVHIGLRLGVARRRGGGGYLILGDALDEARALAEAAAPGHTLCGGVPGRLAQAGFAFREATPLKRRGRRMRVMELLGPRSADRAVLAATGLFHGRREELGGLLDTWRGAVENDVRVAVGVVGDAGIGKTRLLAELARRVAADHGEVRVTAALPGGGDTPYTAVCNLLAQELGLLPARGAAARARAQERLGRLLVERSVSAADQAEVLAATAAAMELSSGAASPGEAPSSLRDRVAFALATVWGLPRAAPARLTVVEDWHWLDGASAHVLGLVLGAPGAGAELVVLTSRPGDDGGPPPWPPSVSPVIRLGELHGEDAEALVRSCLGENVSADDVGLVLRRAGGHPLFIEELAAALRDVPGELPETARSVIAARVDRLPRGAKAALQYAAVYGALVKSRFLEELVGASLARGLALLEQAGLLQRRARSDDESAEGDLEFRHGLLQEVVYESLSGAARREAHRRIGRLLSEHYEAGRARAPAAIARHLELGGDLPRAAIFWLRAGKLALAAFDARAARDAFKSALALVGGDPEREREAYAGRAQALVDLGDHDAARHDLEALAQLAQGDDRRLADVWGRTAHLHLRTGELASALAAADLAASAAERTGDARARSAALRVRAEAHERQADLGRALADVGRALEIARKSGAQADELACLVVAGRIHLTCLRVDAALIQYLPALDRAVALGDPRLEHLLRNNLAIAYLFRGSFAEAMASAERALDLCRRLGDRAREGDALCLVGAIYLALGLTAEAGDHLARGLHIHDATGARLSRADALVYAGRRAAVAGDAAEASRLLDEAAELAARIGARSIVANAKNQRAAALLQEGNAAAAEEVAAEAAALAREADLPGCEVQALSRLALARLEGGDPARARGPSEKAVALLDSLGIMEWSEEEVYYTHHRILRALRDPGADAFLARAHAGVLAKLSRIEPAAWRESFLALEVHQRIRDDFLKLAGDGS